LLLTWTIAPNKLPPTSHFSSSRISAVRDRRPAHESGEGFSSRSIPDHDQPLRAASLSREASAPDPCLTLSHGLDSTPRVVEHGDTPILRRINGGRAAVGSQGPPRTCRAHLADGRGLSFLQVDTPMLPICMRTVLRNSGERLQVTGVGVAFDAPRQALPRRAAWSRCIARAMDFPRLRGTTQDWLATCAPARWGND